MSPEEAKAYGLVDEVVQSRKEILGWTQKTPIRKRDHFRHCNPNLPPAS